MPEGDLPPLQKRTHFCFSSKKDLRGFPKKARRDVGHATPGRVQRGLAPQNFGRGSAASAAAPVEIKSDARFRHLPRRVRGEVLRSRVRAGLLSEKVSLWQVPSEKHY
jgi:hypothetical protein